MKIILIVASLVCNFIGIGFLCTSMNLFGMTLICDNLLPRVIFFFIGVCILICSFETLGVSDEL